MTTPVRITECLTQVVLRGTLQDRIRQTLEPFVYGVDSPSTRHHMRACLHQTVEHYLTDHGAAGHDVHVGLTALDHGRLLVYASRLSTVVVLRRVSGLAMPGVIIVDHLSHRSVAAVSGDNFADGWLFQ